MNDRAELAKQNNAREQKWRELLTDNNLGSDPKLLKKRLRKGIPPGMRIIAWPKLAQLGEHMKKKPFKYQDLLKQTSPCQREIGLDIDRTFAQQRAEIMRRSLKNVLHALSLAYPAIGYCQGMNTLVMRMLETLDDETAFWMVSHFITMYPLLDMNLKNPRSTELQNYILQKLVEIHLKQVHRIITEQEIHYMSFAPRWFLTLLTATLPRQLLMRVYDCFLVEGYKIIFRATLAMIKVKEQQILRNSYEENQRYLSGAPEVYEKMDPDDFINLMFSFSISRKKIGQFETEFLLKHPKFLKELQQEQKEVEQRRIEQRVIKEQEKPDQARQGQNKQNKVNQPKKPENQPPTNAPSTSVNQSSRPPVYGSQSRNQIEVPSNGYEYEQQRSFQRIPSQNIPPINPYAHIPRPIQIPTQPPPVRYVPQIGQVPSKNNPSSYNGGYLNGSGVNVAPNYLQYQQPYRTSHVFEPPLNPLPSQPLNYTNIQTIFHPIRPCSEEEIIEEFPPVHRAQHPTRPFPRYDYFRP